MLYCVFHTRKCSICKTATDSLIGLDESTYKNISVASITPFNFEMYLKIKKIMKGGKIAGYEINGTKNNLYIYKDAYLMIDNERMIKVELDKNGCAKYYFDYPVTDEDAKIYFFGGKLVSKV